MLSCPVFHCNFQVILTIYVLAGFLYTLGAVPSSLDSLGGLLVLTVI